ncbi:MAG: hypothetical protein GXO08_04200 [Aquificae bacterium]|nr:hypothetical protein [Aquificota bacterium]
MASFVVGHRRFDKPFSELYIGSSVVAGNPDSVREKETRRKGEPFEGTTYMVVDHLDLIEVYKGFLVHSNVAPNAVYEILYDALEGEVKGILCGVKEDNQVAYYALVTKESKSIKKQISFYIEYVDFALLPALQKEIEEILTYDEVKIREVFGNPPEKVYAGSFVGSTEDGLVLIPFSTYKVNEVIPAYLGEEDERIPKLELELEELSAKLAELQSSETEEYKKLLERRRELLRELAKLRNRLYNPDILKAVKSKGERLFITQKPEIRYLGENLIQAAHQLKDLKVGGIGRVKGVYAVVTLPVYNNLSGQLQRSYLELMLCLYAEGELFPVELQKARQTVSVMEEALRELIRSLEAGTKPDLSALKERVKENLSLRKRIEDIEKFVLTKLGGEPEELASVVEFLKTLKGELEKGRRVVYSAFSTGRLLSAFEVLSLLQEVGFDPSSLGKEDWSALYEVVDALNETLENTFKAELGEEIKLLTKFFLKRIEEGKPLRYKIKVQGRVEEGVYPPEGRALEVVDLYPNRVLLGVLRGALAKLNALPKLKKVEELEVFFEGHTARLGGSALTAFARKVFATVAKNYLQKVDYDREEEVRALREYLVLNWLGEYRPPTETAKEETSEGEVLEIEDFDDLLEG